MPVLKIGFWLKNLNPDHKCDFINRPLTRYRVHKHSLSSNLGVEQLKRGFLVTGYLLVKQSSRVGFLYSMCFLGYGYLKP